MLIGPDLAAMRLVMAVVPMMGAAAALPAHNGAGTAADMTAALGALMGLVEHLAIAFGLVLGAAEFQVLLVGLIVVRMMLDGFVVDLAAMCLVGFVMEALMTLHGIVPFLRA